MEYQKEYKLKTFEINQISNAIKKVLTIYNINLDEVSISYKFVNNKGIIDTRNLKFSELDLITAFRGDDYISFSIENSFNGKNLSIIMFPLKASLHLNIKALTEEILENTFSVLEDELNLEDIDKKRKGIIKILKRYYNENKRDISIAVITVVVIGVILAGFEVLYYHI
jgi:hypothetical protein